MADTKISALAALLGANSADGDLAVVVDVSDTTMAASGTDKSITVAELAQAIGLNGRLILDNSSDPAAPSSGVRLFKRAIATKNLPAFIGPSGLDSALQPLLARNGICAYKAFPGLTTLTGIGMTLSATGSATATTPATTNLATSVGTLEMAVTAAATTAVAGYRTAGAAAQLNLWRGNAAGLGGFFVVTRFRTMRAWPATQRAFIGLSNSATAPTDVEPSTQLNCIGVGHDAADGNWQVMSNDSVGTCTKTSTGIARPTADDKLYELALFCKPNDTKIDVQFTELVSGTTYSQTITTDLPANTSMMGLRGWRSVGGTSSTIGIGVVSVYTESDF